MWEVGHLASSLVSVAMTGSTLTHSPHHTVLIIMLDLSRPEELWSSFEEAFSVIRNGLKMSYDSDTIQKLQDKRTADRKKELERGVDPFLMKICIIGGRYDEFKVFHILYNLYIYCKIKRDKKPSSKIFDIFKCYFTKIRVRFFLDF